VTEIDIDNVKTLLDAGAASARTASWSGVEGDEHVLTAVVPDGYKIASLDIARLVAPYQDTPQRVRGTVTLTDTVSWLAYFAKHGSLNSEVYGDVRASTVTAVINAPTDSLTPGWGDHRAILTLEHSDAWRAWTNGNGSLFSQETFAEHLEARTPDLIEPTAADMLELAQSFQATTGVTFESGTRLASGQRRLQYLETIEGRAGQRGQLDVPTQIAIRVQVWRGIDIAVPMTARFRYRIAPGGLALGYVLDRVDDVLDAAWQDLLGDLTGALPVPVLAGRAPTYA